MSKVPVLPPSGFRDFLPGEAAGRLALIAAITRTYMAHGFQPIGISMLESLDTLQGKGGGTDNEKLIFKILKRGEELSRAVDAGKNEFADMGLRFDLTLPLARYCARFREQLPKPFKVFQIGPVWRADRPQKGRYREFFQCDVDIVGAKEIGAEVDCINAIYQVFSELKIPGVEIVLNDRRFLTALGEKIGAPPTTWSKCLVILDKLDKIEPSKVREQLHQELIAGQVDLAAAEPLLSALFVGDGMIMAAIDPASHESLGEIQKLLRQTLGAEAKITISPTLIRGQDYYTGTIFELRHEKISGSLGGGGRYNRLLEIFGSPDTPAFGGSIGFERLDLLLQEMGKTETNAAAPQVFFPLFDASLRGPVLEIAGELRKHGVRADVFPDAAKLKNQFKYADDRKIPFVASLGADEWQKKEIKLKDMNARTEKIISLDPLENFVKELLDLCKK
ncbi:MAG: histidine--tRNA ligase [Bacteriovoracia bacterium]